MNQKLRVKLSKILAYERDMYIKSADPDAPHVEHSTTVLLCEYNRTVTEDRMALIKAYFELLHLHGEEALSSMDKAARLVFGDRATGIHFMPAKKDRRNFSGRTFRTYKGERLEDVVVTYKLDGVRAIWEDGKVCSRAGKPLYNLPTMPDGHYEVFLGDFKTTISAVRTHNGATIDPKDIHRLDTLDKGLILGKFDDLEAPLVDDLLQQVLSEGKEGLVLYTNEFMYKVKPTLTYDVEVLSVIPGNGKHTGKLGALVTTMGKVGTGFTDAERDEFQKNPPIGKTIEVECMTLTEAGKFRHPRFKQLREDK